VIALALLLACGVPRSAPGAPEDPSDAPVSAAPGGAITAETRFVGRLEPADATRMFAPPNYFKLGGWNSSSSNTKLAELKEDGAEVVEGENVAEFEFRGKDALDWVERRLRNTEARAAQRRVRMAQHLARLNEALERKQIGAERARLDTLQARAVSENEAALLAIDLELAEFEVEATERLIVAQKLDGETDTAYHIERIAAAQHRRDLYDRYEARFVVKAPHAGVVRHAYNSRTRRRMQQGDNMNAGVEVLSIARGTALSARFFVPEAEIARLNVGDTVTVISPESGDELSADVERIEPFPQEMGFLREDESLPGAREKAHVVVARLADTPEHLSAGGEISVTWRRP